MSFRMVTDKYILEETNTGGKAGKGNNKTGSIKVLKRNEWSGCAHLEKYIRYKMNSFKSKCDAIEKAKDYIKDK